MQVEVMWLLPDGQGAGRGPDGILHVPGGLPGDLVEAEAVSRQGSTTTTSITALVRPSLDRRPPPCPWSASCGGCDLDALSSTGQIRAKAEMVRHAARLDEAPPINASPRASGYRARVRLEIREGRVGFHGARSHQLVEIGVCGIARPEVALALDRFRSFLNENPSEGLTHVELRSDGQRVVFSLESGGSVPRITRDALPGLGDVALDGRRIAGEPTLTLSVLGHRLRASPKSFYQVNLEINEALVAYVLARLAEVSPERALDLYSGIGNFGLPIASRLNIPVLAVEREGQATEDLKSSAESAGLAGLRTLALPVEKMDPSREPFDVVVLDPPRAGAPGLLPKLLLSRPRRIVYVACYPPSAARDLKPALDAGYTLSGVQAFDQFPDTHHVEAVFVLDRGTKPLVQAKKARR